MAEKRINQLDAGAAVTDTSFFADEDSSNSNQTEKLSALQMYNYMLTKFAAVPLPLADGGTNAALTANNGGILYSTATAAAILAGTATAGKMLQSGSTGAPSWSTPTYPSASASSGKFIRSDGTNWVASTPTLPTTVGTSGKVLQSDGTNYVESTPTYPSSSGIAGKILRSDGTNNIYTTSIFADTYTASNLLYSNGANTISGLATANNGALVTNGSGIPSISSTLPSAVQANITGLGTVTSGTWNGSVVGATYGGSGVANPTANGVLIANGSSPFSSQGLTNGQLLIGSTGNAPSAASLTAGSGVIISNGSGTITISSSGSGGAVDGGVKYGLQHTWSSASITAISAGNVNIYNGSVWIQTTYATSTNINITTSGAGGLDTGSVAANTTYYVIAVGGSGQTPIMMYTTNPASPTYPINYTYSRVIAVVQTESGSTNIRKFYCVGLDNTLVYTWDSLDSALTPVSGSTSVNTTTALTGAVPVGAGNMITSKAYIRGLFKSSASWNTPSQEALFFYINGSTTAPAYIGSTIAQGSTIYSDLYCWVPMPASASNSFTWQVNANATTHVDINVKGFEIQI